MSVKFDCIPAHFALQNPVFSSLTLRGLKLRNRFIRAAANEGLCPNGQPSDQLIRHHETMAKHGVALTCVAYASVSPEGITTLNQLPMHEKSAPFLKRLTNAVHNHGGAVSIQLTHAGRMSDSSITGVRPLAPSMTFSKANLTFAKQISRDEGHRILDSYARAAEIAMRANFDAVEVHCGHGYLLSQFISPLTNRRKDEWGGSLEGRMRFPLLVIDAVRRVVGDSVPIFVKQNMEDGFWRGLPLEEGLAAAQMFRDRTVDALVLSGGFVDINGLYMMRGDVPLGAMIKHTECKWKKVALALFGPLVVKKFKFEEGFFQEKASRFKSIMPCVLLGGLRRLDAMNAAIGDGFAMVGMARPFYREPNIVEKFLTGEAKESACIPCNQCIAHTLGSSPSHCPFADSELCK